MKTIQVHMRSGNSGLSEIPTRCNASASWLDTCAHRSEYPNTPWVPPVRWVRLVTTPEMMSANAIVAIAK